MHGAPLFHTFQIAVRTFESGGCYKMFGNFYPKGSAVGGNADLADYNFDPRRALEVAGTLTPSLRSGLRLRGGGIELR